MPLATERIEWMAGEAAAQTLGASARKRGAVASASLGILSLLYGTGVRTRNSAYEHGLLRARRVSIPVISIGNIVAGGAGKTPFTRWLSEQIAARGKHVAVLHGGYGSDEPALHRLWQDSSFVYEARDRVRSAQQASQAGADVVLLDDGFQHRRLARDLDIVLVPAETRSRNLLPLGPLREPESALARADLLVMTRKTTSLSEVRAHGELLRADYGKPYAVAAILPNGIRNAAHVHDGYTPAKVVVVCAVARPDLLLAQLALQHVNVDRMLAYPDHHDYTSNDAADIRAAAGDMPILCTEKDAVKLKSLIEPQQLWVLQQRVVVEEGADIMMDMVERVL